jgi:hypothetical protein
LSVLIGDGSGGFAAPVSVSAGSNPNFVAIGDVKLDLVAANLGGGNVSVLLGDGAGAFTPAATGCC